MYCLVSDHAIYLNICLSEIICILYYNSVDIIIMNLSYIAWFLNMKYVLLSFPYLSSSSIWPSICLSQSLFLIIQASNI